MDFSPYSTEDKQQKVRIIIATAAIAVIVLGIATWAIIAIVGGKENKVADDQTPAVAVDDNAASNANNKQPETAPETEGVNTEVEKTEEPTITVVHSTGDDAPASLPTPVTAQETVPTTGPEEILPLALVAGMAATYVSSKKLAKSEA